VRWLLGVTRVRGRKRDDARRALCAAVMAHHVSWRKKKTRLRCAVVSVA
jgi:hypothetical protein